MRDFLELPDWIQIHWPAWCELDAERVAAQHAKAAAEAKRKSGR